MLQVQKPKITKNTIKKALEKFKNISFENFNEFLSSCNSPKYKQWKKIKHSSFENFSSEEIWVFLSMKRKQLSVNIPIRNESGSFFSFAEMPRYRKIFHEFDKLTSGHISSHDPIHNTTFIQEGIIEESIESSRMEGAVTTVKDARKMLHAGEKPKNQSEQMILNNYETMRKIKSEWKNEEMSLALLFKIHASITKNTDVDELDIFRLRKNSDKIKVVDSVTGEIAYICPDEVFLNKEIKRLIDFANDKIEEKNTYSHPLLKAIMLHFWVGYLHPFTDGNGRTARSLFYWYLLRNGCWAIPFLPISNKIINSYGQYRDAFLLTEQIDNDFTYFFDYHIRQIQLSIKDFQKKVEKIKNEKQTENKLLFSKENFNQRQIQLLRYFFMKKTSKTTYNIHKNYHQISLLSSRSDLLSLQEKGFLCSKKSGRTLYFIPTDKIEPLFSEKQ